MLAGSVTAGAGLRNLTAYLAPPFAPDPFVFFFLNVLCENINLLIFFLYRTNLHP